MTNSVNMARIQFLGCLGGLAMTGCVDVNQAQEPVAPTNKDWVPNDCVDKRGGPYGSQASLTVKRLGNHVTGVFLVDLNGDQLDDLVTANGNDYADQPTAIYYQSRSSVSPDAPRLGIFPYYPDWRSSHDFHGPICVTDLDSDGCDDLVVVQHFGRTGEYSEGGAKIFMNKKTGDSCTGMSPDRDAGEDYFVRAGAWVVNCALGDADGDGDSDLALALATTSNGRDGVDQSFSSGAAVVYENIGGVLAEDTELFRYSPEAGERKIVGAVTFADVDEDGLVELVVGTNQILVFEKTSAHPNSFLNKHPVWTSLPNSAVSSYGIDVARLSPEGDIAIAASFTSFNTRGVAGYPFEIFIPSKSRDPLKSSTTVGDGSFVSLVDVNNDKRADLVAGRWTDDNLVDKKPGSAIRIYTNIADQRELEPESCIMSENTVKGQMLAFGRFGDHAPAPTTSSLVYESSKLVLNIKSSQWVRRVLNVRVFNDAATTWDDIPPAQWSHANGEPIFYVSSSYLGRKIKVIFESVEYPDLVVGDVSGNNIREAPFLFRNRGRLE